MIPQKSGMVIIGAVILMVVLAAGLPRVNRAKANGALFGNVSTGTTTAVPVAVSATTTQAGSDPFSGFVVVLTALGLCGYVIKNKNDKN